MIIYQITLYMIKKNWITFSPMASYECLDTIIGSKIDEIEREKETSGERSNYRKKKRVGMT